MLATVSPTKLTNDHPMPFCCIQIATNYKYKGKCLMCVGTVVQPVTNDLSKLYNSIC